MSGVIGDLEQLECLYTEELEYPRHKGELGYPGQTSPTTDQDIFSSWLYEQSF